jgi:cation transport ATPase
MGSGTALARAEAQVEIAGDDLTAIPLLIEAGKALRRVVRGNLAWTFAYNAAALALAVTGNLHPIAAALAMVLSSLVVGFRSARLLRFGAETPR